MSENKSHFKSSHVHILDYPFSNHSCVCKAMPQQDEICGKGRRKKRIFFGQADRKVGGGGVSPIGPD